MPSIISLIQTGDVSVLPLLLLLAVLRVQPRTFLLLPCVSGAARLALLIIYKPAHLLHSLLLPSIYCSLSIGAQQRHLEVFGTWELTR
jgi:hypothetical protein